MMPFLADTFSSLESLLSDKQADLGLARDEAEELLSEVKLIKSVLKNAHRGRVGNKMFSDWSGEIEKVAYDVEDLVQIHSHDTSMIKGIGKFLPFPSDYSREEKIAKHMSLLRQKFKHLTHLGEIYGLKKELPEVGDPSKARGEAKEEKPWQSRIDDNIFVGREVETDKLWKLILDDSEVTRILVTGMAGIGKTTLAKRIYEDKSIRIHFQASAWVHVGEAFDTGAIFRFVLEQLVPDTTEEMLSNYSKLDMCERIYNTQQSMKCLVVLDDVRFEESWDSLRIAFPTGNTRSKLLITSRIVNPAYKKKTDIVYEIQPLSEDESWKLLEEKGYLNRCPDPGMHDKTKAAVKFCHGSPFEIDLLGRLLASMSTEVEWNNALKSFVDVSVLKEPQEPQVLSLSYDTLSEPLKHCFLYLGLFPEVSPIEVEKLYQLWIAEGLIPDDYEGAEVTEMDKAEKYLDELTTRGMVEVQEVDIPNIRRFKSCSVHDFVRDLCIRKSWEQSFSKVIDRLYRNESLLNPSPHLSIDRIRRLAIFIRENDHREEFSILSETARHLRSLLCFNAQRHQEDLLQLPKSFNFKFFDLLRVLNFEGFEFPEAKLPDGIGGLIALRYLSFKGCRLEEIPASISQLTNLQIVDLRIGPWRMAIPNVLWQLRNIRHLYLPRMYDAYGDNKLRLDTLKHLETLENFDTRACNVLDLLFLTNLRNLTATFEGYLEDLDCVLKCINVTLSYLRQASIEVSASNIYMNDRYDAVRKLFGSYNLHTLHIKGIVGKLPEVVSSSLTVLVLKNTELVENPMPTLGKFPNLWVLVLGCKAFLGMQMICSASSFQQLRHLTLENLNHLETLVVEETAMPNLSTLTIEGCQNLEHPKLHSRKNLKMMFKSQNKRRSLKARDFAGEGSERHQLSN